MTAINEGLEYKVLGQVAFSTDDEIAIIRSLKQRLILALLLCHYGESVSVASIIDALWDEKPPVTARENVRVFVYKLRRAIGVGHGIKYETSGYTLRPEPGQFDATRFEELARKAESAAGDGDSFAAGAFSREALELWRGSAYGDLSDHPTLRDDVSRLEDRRLRVLEMRIEADLALGAHAQLVSELTKLVAEMPYREELRSQLMLALYRCGRQAESLAVFQECRRVLSDELGILPGPGLRLMYEAILRSEPGLELGRLPSSLRELPPDHVDFTGRASAIERLTEVLPIGERRLAVISGAAGVGKSALAVHVAHRLAAQYEDGQLYIDLHGTTPNVEAVKPAFALGRFIRSLGGGGTISALGEDELAARYRSLTAERRVLVVLDNAADATQVRLLVPSGSKCGVIITSRRSLLSLDGATLLPIDVLTAGEALELLRRIAGAERVDAVPDDTREILQLCGYLPLAIRTAGARLAARPAWSMSDLVALLAREDHRLFELRADERTVKASLAVSYRSLKTEQAHMFRVVGLLEGQDIDIAMAARLANCSARRTEHLLSELVEAGLLVSLAYGHFQLHELTRLYARECAAVEGSAAAHD